MLQNECRIKFEFKLLWRIGPYEVIFCLNLRLAFLHSDWLKIWTSNHWFEARPVQPDFIIKTRLNVSNSCSKCSLNNLYLHKGIVFQNGLNESLNIWATFVGKIVTKIFPNSANLVKLKPSNSVTRLGDLLDFGQLFKAFGNN